MAVPIGISPNNAIVAAVFVLQFEQSISDDLRAKMTHDMLDRGRYPGFSLMPTQQMNFVIMGQPGPMFQQNMSVVPVWKKFNVDGTLVHEIRVEASSIVFVCHDYSRWNDVMPQAVSDMLKLIRVIETNKISAMVLQVTDAFRLDASETAFIETLNDKSKYLPSSIVENGDVLWHVHQGWFDADLTGCGDNVLNRLNINVLDNISHQREIQIEHFIEQRFRSSIECESVDERCLYEKFNSSHSKNKSLMLNLLHDTMQRKVSLNHE
jgi:uncharacterized protein (TIGR04255 family)